MGAGKVWRHKLTEPDLGTYRRNGGGRSLEGAEVSHNDNWMSRQ